MTRFNNLTHPECAARGMGGETTRTDKMMTRVTKLHAEESFGRQGAPPQCCCAEQSSLQFDIEVPQPGE